MRMMKNLQALLLEGAGRQGSFSVVVCWQNTQGRFRGGKQWSLRMVPLLELAGTWLCNCADDEGSAGSSAGGRWTTRLSVVVCWQDTQVRLRCGKQWSLRVVPLLELAGTRLCSCASDDEVVGFAAGGRWEARPPSTPSGQVLLCAFIKAATSLRMQHGWQARLGILGAVQMRQPIEADVLCVVSSQDAILGKASSVKRLFNFKVLRQQTVCAGTRTCA